MTQVKSRIDTLEQAGISSVPRSDSPQDQSDKDSDALSKVVAEIKAAAWHRLGATDTQYTKYKWLLDPQVHKAIENLLADCNSRSSKLALDSVNPAASVEKFKENLGVFIGKTQELEKAYEDAWLSTIERLYLLLNKEVGISIQLKSN